MNCRELEGHLSAYLAEETAPDLRRSIMSHLSRCKKCRVRIKGLMAKKGGKKKVKKKVKKEVVGVPSEAVTPSRQETSPSSRSTVGILSALWRYPVVMIVTVVLIVGTFFLHHRGAADLEADFSDPKNVASPVAEALPASAPAENDGGGQEKEGPILPPLPPQTAPAAPPPSPPVKVHQETTKSLPKEARQQATDSRSSAIKLLLISRNIKEAADAVASHGKVLSRKRDEMEARVVLLIPADRYETFSQSLQSLGLVKDLSKKPPPTEGSLKVEITIE